MLSSGEMQKITAAQAYLTAMDKSYIASMPCVSRFHPLTVAAGSPDRSLSSISHAWSRLWNAECRIR